jgi:hypothetical protein
LSSEVCLFVPSDSAFKKEEDTGHALKGGNYLLIDKSYRQGHKANCHFIEYVCARNRHVTRSTFGAELFAACDAVDLAMLIASLLHQVDYGSMTPAAARQCRERNGWKVEIDLAVDAYSVYAAVTASQVKAPAEKALLSHVQYLRELLDRKICTHLVWLDTRDMVTDGLTKGSVDRSAIDLLMSGTYQWTHKAEFWHTKLETSKFSNAVAQLQ